MKAKSDMAYINCMATVIKTIFITLYFISVATADECFTFDMRTIKI